MASFSSNVRVMQDAMGKVSVKIFRDFMELENLQNSYKSSLGFAQKTVQRVAGDLEYLLGKSREDFGVLINGRDDFNKKREREYNWLISPICGFNNLLRSVPYFCTVISLEKVDEKGERMVVASLVENVITKESFVTEEDKGAYVNGRRIRVSTRSSLDNSVVALDSVKDGSKIGKISKSVSNIKINNCLALDLAYIACGKYDVGVVDSPNEYELGAGLLLLREAGGCVKRFEKGGLVLSSANDVLIDKVKKFIN